MRKIPLGVALSLLLLVGGCGAVGYGCYSTALKTGEETFTVESKERIAEDNDGKWMVYATDGREFQVADNLFFGLFDSTDRYRALEVGETYSCQTIGVRWPLLSEYRNLRECEEAP